MSYTHFPYFLKIKDRFGRSVGDFEPHELGLAQKVATYIIEKHGNVVRAINGMTGRIEFQRSGNDLTPVINSVIEALPYIGYGYGGKIVIMPGDYLLSDSIVVNRPVCLEGVTGGMPRLVMKSGVYKSAIKLDIASNPAYPSQSEYLVVLRNLYITHQSPTGGSSDIAGIETVSWARDLLIEHVLVHSYPGTGFKLTNVHNLCGIHLVGENCEFFGAWLADAYNDDYRPLTLIDCIMDTNGKVGLYIYGTRGDYQIIGGTYSNNGEKGIHVTANTRGIVVGTTIYNNTKYGIFVDGSSNLRILGNRIFGTHDYGIYVVGGASDVLIECNIIQDAATLVYVDPAATNVKVKNNLGYITENKGTAVIPAGSTRVTVNHGLAAAPTKIIVTPLGDPGDRFWVENVTDTSFDIVVATAPAADISFYWEAEV